MSLRVSVAPDFLGGPCVLPQIHAGASEQRDDASKMHVGGRATAATPASAAASMVTRSLKLPPSERRRPSLDANRTSQTMSLNQSTLRLLSQRKRIPQRPSVCATRGFARVGDIIKALAHKLDTSVETLAGPGRDCIDHSRHFSNDDTPTRAKSRS